MTQTMLPRPTTPVNKHGIRRIDIRALAALICGDEGETLRRRRMDEQYAHEAAVFLSGDEDGPAHDDCERRLLGVR